MSYFNGNNETVRGKTVTRQRRVDTVDPSGRPRVRTVTEEEAGNRIAGGILYRVVCQQVQYLLQNGLYTSPGVRERLGEDFDRELQRMAEKAIVQGVCWGFWNGEHLEVLEAARAEQSGFLPLRDELTGEVKLGIQFFRGGADRPMFIRVFDPQGIMLLRRDKNSLTLINAWPYAEKTGSLPVIALWGREEHTAILTPALRSKIDAYDRILSDFADNLDRANDVYWVLNNFGGSMDDVAEMLGELHRLKAVACLSDGSGSTATAEPRTIEVPYAARQTALRILEDQIYADAMALNPRDVTGGSLTNVAIRTACANLDLQADRFEWQVDRFMRSLLRLLGIRGAEIRFQRQTIVNETETVSAIYQMRGDIDRETALRLNPLLQPEEVERLIRGGEKHGT